MVLFGLEAPFSSKPDKSTMFNYLCQSSKDNGGIFIRFLIKNAYLHACKRKTEPVMLIKDS